jgi:apolipoprotein N-acyltransferase
MMWALSYLGANFALVIVVVLAVLALGAVAWFAKNWKVAVVAVIIAAAGFGAQQFDKNGYDRRVAEDVAQQTKVLQGRLDALAKVAAAYAERAANDADAIAALREQASHTPANNSLALPEDSAKRVGDVR